MSEEKGFQKPSEQQLEQLKVELDADTYAALLERIDELEARESARPADHEDRSIIDELADEGRRDSDVPSISPPENLDSMSNTDLVNFIVDVINRQASPRLRDMEVKYETLRVLREIDKAEMKYDDFWRYESKIKEISMANPSLNIEQAYKLAKAESPPPPKKEGEQTVERRTRTEKLLNLPPKGVFGEKPSVATSSTVEVNRGMTLKSAAERAWEESVGKGKPEP